MHSFGFKCRSKELLYYYYDYKINLAPENISSEPKRHFGTNQKVTYCNYE